MREQYRPEAQGIPVPYVVKRQGNQDRVMDIYSRMLEERIVFVNTPINDDVAGVVQLQLLHLAAEDADKDISMYINSPGGSITAGMAIYDTMQYIKPKVRTICTGLAASMGSILLSAGHPGQRFILPNARVMVHQPSGGVGERAQATDIGITYELIMDMQKQLYGIYELHCGGSYDEWKDRCERDNWLRAEQAIDLNLVDEIVTSEKLQEIIRLQEQAS